MNEQPVARTSKKRSDFERWATSVGFSVDRRPATFTNSKDRNGRYDSDVTWIAWQAWEARADAPETLPPASKKMLQDLQYYLQNSLGVRPDYDGASRVTLLLEVEEALKGVAPETRVLTEEEYRCLYTYHEFHGRQMGDPDGAYHRERAKFWNRPAQETPDARDAERWRLACSAMCYSFDGQDRTHYLKAVGRESFEETVDRRGAQKAPVKPEPPYRIRSFWSPCKRYLMTVCVSQANISIVDDNGVIYEATGEEDDIADPNYLQPKAEKAPDDLTRRPTGQCSWGCYYGEDGKLVRDSACTVHGASSSENGNG